ncbi:MAG: hypothetical protein ABTQ73_03470 [Caldilineales bacterium]
MTSYFSDHSRQDRASDLALLLGHTMQCETCREKLLAQPERVMLGRKMTGAQREALNRLTPEDFENAQTLAVALDMSLSELSEGINHPRARLRHL